MLSDALYYPTRGEQSVLTIILGGVLSLLSILLIPLLFVFGYYVRVLETTANGADEPPQFDDWGSLGVSGLVAVLVTAAYYLVPVLAFAGLGGIGALTGDSGAAMAGMAVALVVAGVLWVALTYVYPAALTNFATSGRAGAAFAFGDIKDVVLSGSYLGAWAVGFLIFAGGFVVLGVLSLIPVVGTIVGLFVNFYIQMAAYRVFATAYRRARAGDLSETSAAAPV